MFRLLVLFAFLLVPFFRASANAQETEADDAGPLRIGFILPLSGPLARQGADARCGAQLMLNQLKSESGADLPFQLVFEDSRGSIVNGMDAYRKLRKGGVKFVVTQNDDLSLSVSAQANNDRVLQLAITTTSPSYSKANDFTFRINGSTKLEARFLASVLKEKTEEDGGTAAVLAEDSPHFEQLRKDLLAELSSLSKAPVINENLSGKDGGFNSLILRLRDARVRYVVLLAGEAQAADFVKQQAKLALGSPAVILSMPEASGGFFQAAGSSTDGILLSRIKLNGTHPAAAAYKQRYGREVNYYSANGYDAAALAYQAGAKCGFRSNPECLKDALSAIKSYDGLSGRKGFDDTYGDMSDDYWLLVSKKGQFVPSKANSMKGSLLLFFYQHFLGSGHHASLDNEI